MARGATTIGEPARGPVYPLCSQPVGDPQPVQMTLLLDELNVVELTGDPTGIEVSGIEHDSTRVASGYLFCCIPGRHSDGHHYAAEAVERGAVGLVCERDVGALPAPVVRARIAPGTARSAMAHVAAAFYGHPSRELLMVGVTGTNGKTTVVHLLGTVFSRAGWSTTVVGTLSGVRTTPEAPELQRLLADALERSRAPEAGMPKSGDEDGRVRRGAVAMEVSSHALAQARVEGIHFDAAVFTNLSHDHLDFHESMESYFRTKASLFLPDHAVRAVVNADDSWGERLVEQLAVPRVAVHGAELTDVALAAGSSCFTWRGHRVKLALTGFPNVVNAHLAAETALAVGIAPEAVVDGLSHAGSVPGRLELLRPPASLDPGFSVMVDYAHTPASLRAVLAECRRLARSEEDHRVLVVFGCGGDRDRSKRPRMGEAATELADVSIVTTDNPRGEDPAAIIREVCRGVRPSVRDAERAGTLVVEPDRREAIARALSAARPGDVVLVAGKGHETYQEVAGERLPFDDRLVALELLGVAPEVGARLVARAPSEQLGAAATPSLPRRAVSGEG